MICSGLRISVASCRLQLRTQAVVHLPRATTAPFAALGDTIPNLDVLLPRINRCRMIVPHQTPRILSSARPDTVLSPLRIF